MFAVATPSDRALAAGGALSRLLATLAEEDVRTIFGASGSDSQLVITYRISLYRNLQDRAITAATIVDELARGIGGDAVTIRRLLHSPDPMVGNHPLIELLRRAEEPAIAEQLRQWLQSQEE